jgi:thioredoxin reductase
VAARLILATGVVDELPALPGLREQWGVGVLQCPYCHGYEAAGGRLGVLAFLPLAAHQALLIRDWGEVTFFPNGIARPDAAARGVMIEEGEVAAVVGEPGRLAGIQLRDGRTIALDDLFAAVPARMASPLPAALGCAFADSPIGPIIRTDASGQTTVPGVFAAGEAARAPSSLAGVVAVGYLAGVAAHQPLVMPAHWS